MIPGPSELSSEVLNTMSRPLPAHYMDDWVPMYRETVDLTKKVLRTKNDTFIITGSGSAGMEAACATIIEPGDKVIADVTGLMSSSHLSPRRVLILSLWKSLQAQLLTLIVFAG